MAAKRTSDQLDSDGSDGSDISASVGAFVAGIRKRMKKVSSAAMDTAIDTVVAQSQDAAAEAVAGTSDGDTDRGGGVDGGADIQRGEQQSYELQLQELRATVRKQQAQIDFLMSVLGFENIPEQHQPDRTSSSLQGSSSSSSSALVTAPSVPPPPAAGPALATKNVKQVKPLPLAAAFTQAVVSAVYQDFDDRDRRACNVIVSGLPPGDADDKQAMTQLVLDEFLVRPEIVRTRRLGQPRAGKVQPLLVTFKDKRDAELLIQNAKKLRRSASELVRRSVFINADVTRAEAHAAYVARCERRQRMATIRSRGPPRPDDAAAQSSTAAVSGASLSTDGLRSSGPTSSVTQSSGSAAVAASSQVDSGAGNGRID